MNHGIGGRWWYVLPDWPPPDFDYVAALAERGSTGETGLGIDMKIWWRTGSFPEKSIWKISMVSRVRNIGTSSTTNCNSCIFMLGCPMLSISISEFAGVVYDLAQFRATTGDIFYTQLA